MDFHPDSKDMQWSNDYDDLSNEEKQLWRLTDYFKMREMVDKFYDSYEKSKELIAWLNSIVSEQPKYQVVIDVLDKYTDKSPIGLYVDGFLCEITDHVRRNEPN